MWPISFQSDMVNIWCRDICVSLSAFLICLHNVSAPACPPPSVVICCHFLPPTVCSFSVSIPLFRHVVLPPFLPLSLSLHPTVSQCLSRPACWLPLTVCVCVCACHCFRVPHSSPPVPLPPLTFFPLPTCCYLLIQRTRKGDRQRERDRVPVTFLIGLRWSRYIF